MTDAAAQPPEQPANKPSEEVRADPDAWPTDWSLSEAKAEPAPSRTNAPAVIELGAAPQPSIEPSNPSHVEAMAVPLAPPPLPPAAPSFDKPIPPPLEPAPAILLSAAPTPPPAPEPARPAQSSLPPLPPPFSAPRPEPASGPADPTLPGAPPPNPPMPPEPPFSGAPPAPPQPFPEPAPRKGGSGWAMATHLTSLFDFGLSILMVGFIGPLVVWLVKKDEDPEADWHGRESLNFQINLLLLWLVAFPLYCACGLGLAIHLLLPVYKIILVVIASMKAADGERFRYPFTLRLLHD